jgi:hypothetical protein
MVASGEHLLAEFGSYDTGDLEIAKRSGATVYRVNLDYACAWGQAWSQFDPIVKAAWERGVTILPILLKSNTCEHPTQQAFLLSNDPGWAAWAAWAKAAVERYGANGTFWEGKSNPTPITAWEVGNEPNLAQNNPGGKEVQPAAYGQFLEYTAGALQEGAKAKTGTTTQVLSAGPLPGGSSKTLWITEMGWAVPPGSAGLPANGGHTVSEDKQASLLNTPA